MDVFKSKVVRLPVPLAILLLASRAAADDDADAKRRLVSLDQRAHIMALEFREDPGISDPLHLLVDAQVLLGTGKVDAATAAFQEILRKWPDSRSASEARSLLGESFLKQGHMRAARAQFEEVIDPFIGTKAQVQALERLTEIALRTGEFDDIERVFDKLDQLPSAAREPSVPYARAKYLYFRERLDEAAAAFARIPTSSPYFLRAHYFVATIFVSTGDLTRATQGFEGVQRSGSRADVDVEVVDLARLALGRIFRSTGHLDRSIAAYRSVSPTSKSHLDALYELGWTLLALPDITGAEEVFRRLLRGDPDGPRAPDLSLVVGSLQVRLGGYRQAGATFAGIRDQFEPMYRKLSAWIADGRDLEDLSVSAILPPSMLGWVRSDPQVQRLMTLASDLDEMQLAVREATLTAARLDRALARPNKVGLFDDLAETRKKETELLASVLDLRQRFASTSHDPAHRPDPTLAGIVARSSFDVVSRVEAVQAQLAAFDRRIEAEAGRRLASLKVHTQAERSQVDDQTARLRDVLADARGPGGVAYLTYARIIERMYEVVVRSDLGLTDVAWGLKESSSATLGDLLLIQQSELDAVADQLQEDLDATSNP